MESKDYYITILTNGETIVSKQLNALKTIPFAEYHIYVHYDHTYTAPSGNKRDWFRHEIIDVDGKPSTIRIGNFEVAYIEADQGFTQTHYGRKVHILDKRLNVLHKIDSKTEGVTFIIKDVVPFLQKLNEFDSWKAYEQSIEMQSLKEENERLKNKLKEVEAKLKVE